jgi:hypothetical protein
MAILENAAACLKAYDSHCLHYNIIAEAVYRARNLVGPLSGEFGPYIIAGLIGFDMRRTMGEGDPYSTTGGFGLHLSNSLGPLEGDLRRLTSDNLATADLSVIGPVVTRAYDGIADGCARRGRFHVGATKILHWLFPDLFIMLDRNAAMAFQKHHMVGFRQTTQPGYSAQNYFKCLELAKKEIVEFGVERFHALEPDTPVARIFDKIAFVVGARGVSSA